MSLPAAISAQGLSKQFPRDRRSLSALRRAIAGRADESGFFALRAVSFSVPQESALGIVGRNGSGKSTLLQLICGTLAPSAGSIQTHGRIAAMLELGAGFNPDFTGRENVFLAASIYGLDDDQIAGRLPAIEAFADIGAYIDRPVSEYSSGMYARLAFAVCAHVDADILVVDEILGVGDAAFQRKCQRFMQEFRQHGTLVFVSHNAGSVLSACDRAIWLEGGEVMADGPVDDVLRHYLEAEVAGAYGTSTVDRSSPAGDAPLTDLRLGHRNIIDITPFDLDCPRHGFGGAEIETCFFSDGDGSPVQQIRGGDLVTLHVRARVSRDIASPIVGYMFRNAAGQNLFGDNTFLAYRRNPPHVSAGSTLEARMAFRMPNLPRGLFTLAPSILSGTQASHVPVSWLEDALTLSVRNDAVRHGKVGMTMFGFRAEAK